MSLQVKINSKAVRLPEDFELAINLKNNLLDGDREDATYPMEVNLASNRQVFGFVDRTHTDMTEKLQAGVSFGPYQLLNGQCVLSFTFQQRKTLFGGKRGIGCWMSHVGGNSRTVRVIERIHWNNFTRV